MKDQSGFAVLSLVIILTCASIYAISYYVCNADFGDECCAPVEEMREIKQGSFLEPEDKCLFT